ncbi:MAG: hypothetical protein HOI95_06215 [Chromatiales bacterium]|mgnify:FL=1|jgi:hypothetical protein|nr:hypothetical protein [Chromatiales bacterium]
MNIKHIQLTPDARSTDFVFQMKYEVQTTYIKLFLEACLKRHKVDLGAFNKLVFCEGGDPAEEFQVLANDTLQVALQETFSKLESLQSDQEHHDYFVDKVLEGLRRFDSRFDSSLAQHLEPKMRRHFRGGLFFDRKFARKQISGCRLEVVGRYTRTDFTLSINSHTEGAQPRSTAVYRVLPEEYTVNFDIHRVQINNKSIRVLSKASVTTLECDTGDFCRLH